MDAEAPPPFADKVLTELHTALTGVRVTRSLLEEDPAFVAQFGAGDINQECMKFRVSGKRELATLKMKLIQRRAYGFRNFENYRLRVIAACG